MFEILTKNLNDILGEEPKVSYGRKLREKVEYVLERYDDEYTRHYFLDLKEQIYKLLKDNDVSQDQLVKLLYSLWMVLEQSVQIVRDLPAKPRTVQAPRPAARDFHADTKVAKRGAKMEAKVDGKAEAKTESAPNTGARVNGTTKKDRIMVHEGGQTIFRNVKPVDNGAEVAVSNSKGTYKTKMCHYIQTKGHCTRGNSCTFAHDESELRPVAEGDASTSTKTEEPVTEPAVVTSVATSATVTPAPEVTKPTVVEPVKVAPIANVVATPQTPAPQTQAPVVTAAPIVNVTRQTIPVATPQQAVQFITEKAKQATLAQK
jgi:hypothetical protein